MTTIPVTLDEGATTPTRQTPGAAGYDLTTNETATVPADGTTTLVSTGVHIVIPDGHVGLVIARSSLHRKHLRLTNSVGVIDPDYRGPIRLALTTTEDTLAPVTINAGDRLAQLLIIPCLTPDLTVVDRLDDTTRGTGGFGSTNEGGAAVFHAASDYTTEQDVLAPVHDWPDANVIRIKRGTFAGAEVADLPHIAIRDIAGGIYTDDHGMKWEERGGDVIAEWEPYTPAGYVPRDPYHGFVDYDPEETS